MSEITNKTKYLDLEGLKQYDELIKNFINTGDKTLSDAIAVLSEKIGSLELENSDDKNLTEIVDDIYSSLADIIADQSALAAMDVDLAARIQKVADDLQFVTGGDSENEATLGEINATLTQVQSDLEDIRAIAEQAQADAAAATTTAGEAKTAAEQAQADAAAAATDAQAASGSASAAQAAAESAQSSATAAESSAATAAESANSATVSASAAQAAAESAAAESATATTTAGEAKSVAEQAQADAATAVESASQAQASAATAVADATAAKDAVNVLNGDGEGSVKKIAEDAAATAVAAVIDGAESDFDTLKEVADWIRNDKTGAAALQTTVSTHTASIAALTEDLGTLDGKVGEDIQNLADHMSDASAAIGELSGRITELENAEDTHESIQKSDIEDLFNKQ
jgi:chromosome segregation ATPase